MSHLREPTSKAEGGREGDREREAMRRADDNIHKRQTETEDREGTEYGNKRRKGRE